MNDVEYYDKILNIRSDAHRNSLDIFSSTLFKLYGLCNISNDCRDCEYHKLPNTCDSNEAFLILIRNR